MHPAPNPSGIAKKIIQIILFETELPNSPITVRAVLTAATFPTEAVYHTGARETGRNAEYREQGCEISRDVDGKPEILIHDRPSRTEKRVRYSKPDVCDIDDYKKECCHKILNLNYYTQYSRYYSRITRRISSGGENIF